MVKKSKKVWTAVITALFVLSISYFALLAPTTAWFYQEYDTDYDFTFGDFAVEYTNPDYNDPEDPTGEHQFDATVTVPLRAATRFADKGEFLFDEVAYAVKVDAMNDGSMPADVSVEVMPATSGVPLPSWLHHFVYAVPSGTTITAPSFNTTTHTWTKGTFKQAIEAMLVDELNLASAASLTDYADFTALENTSGRDNAEEAYSEYDAALTVAVTNSLNGEHYSALEHHNITPVHFDARNPSDPTDLGYHKDIYVVFWAEYGHTTDIFRNMGNVVKLGDVSVKVRMRAIPFVPDTQSLTISNTGSSGAELRITVGSQASFTRTVAAGGSAVITDQLVGDRFTIEFINNTSATLEFNPSASAGTVRGDRITGTIGNQGSTVTIRTKTVATP